MPNRIIHWNELADTPVNKPTKSISVNDMTERLRIRRYKNKSIRSTLRNHSQNKNMKGLSKKWINIRMLRSDFFYHPF